MSCVLQPLDSMVSSLKNLPQQGKRPSHSLSHLLVSRCFICVATAVRCGRRGIRRSRDALEAEKPTPHGREPSLQWQRGAVQALEARGVVGALRFGRLVRVELRGLRVAHELKRRQNAVPRHARAVRRAQTPAAGSAGSGATRPAGHLARHASRCCLTGCRQSPSRRTL